MKLDRPKGLAKVSALIITAVLSLLFVLLIWAKDEYGNLPIFLVFVLVCVLITFFVPYFLIRTYLQNKVRLIYRTMHELRSVKSDDLEMDMNSDVLGEIDKDAQEWVRERREEIEGLKEREIYRREFIGNLSHELKTPLFNIQGYILTLLEGGLEDKNVNREFLEKAARGVERLTHIVEDMDLITKLESGVMNMNFERVDLMSVIEETVSAMKNRSKSAGMRITVKRPLRKTIMVMADKDRLAQIFINLLNNSIRYGKENGNIWIDVLNIEGQLWVEFKDDGIGISNEHLPRLFERFYRVGSSRSRHKGGSGLGLSIVKHIIDAHDQTITVSSREGEGTVFTFTLQIAN